MRAKRTPSSLAPLKARTNRQGNLKDTSPVKQELGNRRNHAVETSPLKLLQCNLNDPVESCTFEHHPLHFLIMRMARQQGPGSLSRP